MQTEDKDRYFHYKEIREKYPQIWSLQEASVYAVLSMLVLFAALVLHILVSILLFPEGQSVFDGYIFSVLLLLCVWTAAAYTVLHVIVFHRMNREEWQKTGRYVLPAFSYYEYSGSKRGYIANTVYNIGLVVFLVGIATILTVGIVSDLSLSGGMAVAVGEEI